MVEDPVPPATDDNPVFQYLTGQRRASHPAMLEAFERESAEAVRTLRPDLDLGYGPDPRQRFDLFRAPAAKATVAYFHAGYWQSRDKAQFRFLAPPLIGAGFDLAVVNYPLCPDATVEALTTAVRDAVPAVHAFVSIGRKGPGRLFAVGHSAGAHLAVELALTDWRARGATREPVNGVVALSGVYDLAPLIATPLNEKLRLTWAAARAASPLLRVRGGMPPALFAVGSLETEAFHIQNRNMCAAWRAAGNVGTTMVVDGADHFSILRSLTPGTELFEAIAALAEG
jgi:arylformamidase